MTDEVQPCPFLPHRLCSASGIRLDFLSLCAFMLSAAAWAQDQSSTDAAKPISWQLQDSGTAASLRGLHVVDKDNVWASGSDGAVIRTTDGGNHWLARAVSGAENLDFRDIHAFDSQTAVIITAGQPARVYRTGNGGQSWSLCYEHPDKRSFFDAVSFWDEQNGIIMSDPIDGRVLLIESSDKGRTWRELPLQRRPNVEEGEAGFAASGTNMCVVGQHSLYIALGGDRADSQHPTSRVIFSHDRGKNWLAASVPMPRSPSSGIFSIDVLDERHAVAVGGDYSNPDAAVGNVAVATGTFEEWQTPKHSVPNGYRSCVARIERKKPESKQNDRTQWLIAVGPSGADLSMDGGQSWQSVNNLGFHSVQFAPDGSAGWATGADGRVAKISIDF